MEHEFLTTHYYTESSVADDIYDTLMNNQDIHKFTPFVEQVASANVDRRNATINLTMDNGEKYTIVIHKEQD